MQIKKSIGQLLMAAFALSIMSCSSTKVSEQSTAPQPAESVIISSALPRAVIYRTDSDYRNQVAVTLSEDGNRIVSFPDPQDIVPSQATPIALANGYLLDRRGINKNTAFLDYTYVEYACLPATPSISELMKHIVKKNAVTEIYVLPIKASEAAKNTALCNEFIANGFENCEQVKSVIPMPTLQNKK